jgi:hypothetical protein
MQKEK